MKSSGFIVVFMLIVIAALFAIRFSHDGNSTAQPEKKPVKSKLAVRKISRTSVSETPVEKTAVATSAVSNACPSTVGDIAETPVTSGTVASGISESVAPTNIPLPRFVGGHRANVPPGGALVTGGWPQPNGNRLLMFASPEPQADGESVVVSSRFLSLPVSRLASGGWEKFITDDAVATAGGVYSAEEYREMMKSVEAFKDVDLLLAPTITTRTGQLATIEIMAERIEKVDGKPVLTRDGLSQSIIARTVEGSADVDLAVTAAQYDSGKNPRDGSGAKDP